MARRAILLTAGWCSLLVSCSSDPATFTSYAQNKAAAGGTYDVTKDTKPTDALALNYANSVEEIFRARSTGARYTREASDTALAGLSAFTGAAETLSISASAVSGIGLAGVGILSLRKIFDARGRSTAYFEAAQRVHGAIKDFRAYNLNNVSETGLSPNGWTLANIVQANIDIVAMILNGNLPPPAILTQASEPMTAEGARVTMTPSRVPPNNIPAAPLVVDPSAVRSARGARPLPGSVPTPVPSRTPSPARRPAPTPEIEVGLPTETEMHDKITALVNDGHYDKNAPQFADILKDLRLNPSDLRGQNTSTKVSEAYKWFPETRKTINDAISRLPPTAPPPPPLPPPTF